jgi:hypothetical protein
MRRRTSSGIKLSTPWEELISGCLDAALSGGGGGRLDTELRGGGGRLEHRYGRHSM